MIKLHDLKGDKKYLHETKWFISITTTLWNKLNKFAYSFLGWKQ